MHVHAIDAGRAGRGADVVAVDLQQLLEVAALDVLQPAFADGAQRLRDVDQRLGNGSWKCGASARMSSTLSPSDRISNFACRLFNIGPPLDGSDVSNGRASR